MTDADAVRALHTAARRYCDERAANWHEAYAELGRRCEDRVPADDGSWGYSDAALRTFPRYLVLEAIRSEVERFVPGDFTSLQQARQYLAAAGDTAQSVFTERARGVERIAMGEERRLFADWARNVGPEELAGVTPLTYRRVLGDAEFRALAERLTSKWGQWYGGSVDRTDIPPTLTLWSHWFADDPHIEALRAAVSGRGHRRIWEIREHDDSFEVDAAAAGFFYNGAEGFWTAGDMDWLVYASHEASVTFGGDWLIEAVKRACPDWEAGVYTGWGNDPPQREP